MVRCERETRLPALLVRRALLVERELQVAREPRRGEQVDAIADTLGEGVADDRDLVERRRARVDDEARLLEEEVEPQERERRPVPHEHVHVVERLRLRRR